ncbi:MAG: hypothetical protein IKY43_04325 [Bacteroidales bacterium]|jgi:hypothetical protein|nr:hypothetical protein [Bacteroidales bacterium]
MKRFIRNIVSATLVLGLVAVGATTTTACSSSKSTAKEGKMYKAQKSKSTVVNRNYKLKGKRNKASYHKL